MSHCALCDGDGYCEKPLEDEDGNLIGFLPFACPNGCPLNEALFRESRDEGVPDGEGR